MTEGRGYARVVVVGSSNTDLIVRAPNIPKPGETVLGSEFLEALGGKGANQAVAAARLGAHVTLVARLGDDHWGARAVAGYRAEGIDTRYVIIDREAPTGVGLIVVDERGENAIAVASGANARLSSSDVSRASRAIQLADVLVLQLETPLDASMRAIEIARNASTRVILNPAPERRLDADILAYVEVLTPNLEEGRALVRALDMAEAPPDPAPCQMLSPCETAAALKTHGPGVVIVTCGAEGVAVADESGVREMSAPPVDAVDTTGAGDAFNGALAVALADGRPIDEAVEWAQRAAAVSVTRRGAQPSLPTRNEIEATLAPESAAS